jgi:hypothetical protein
VCAAAVLVQEHVLIFHLTLITVCCLSVCRGLLMHQLLR